MKKVILMMAVAVAVTACNQSAIGVASNFKEGNFVVGKTGKQEIFDYLGLPQNVQKDKDGNEHLLYLSSEQDLGRCEYCTYAVGRSNLPSIKDKVADHHGAEYVINKKGILIKKMESAGREK